MDRIIGSLLTEFTERQELSDLPEDRRFEHFATYITARRHFGHQLDTVDVVMGATGDTGIDAIAIIANGTLVTDVEALVDLADSADYLEVQFIFVQADRSASFDSGKMGKFAFGVLDFFSEEPALPRNSEVKRAAEIMTAIYDRSGKFKRGNPSCRLYYVTTGKWQGDQVLEARREAAASQLRDLGLFGDVDFQCIGADGAQRLYNQTKNAVSREFTFQNRAEIQEIKGIEESYIGYVPVSQFMRLIADDDGEMLRTIFYDNVRDWQDYNPVNSEIRETLKSDNAERFVLMNNGVTIITRGLTRTGSKFHLEDYQVVNGCQTSNVVYLNHEDLSDAVQIPLRLIWTQDEDVIESIIKATNRQTEVKPEQFNAMTDFAKKLEAFFTTYPLPHRLYYERRSGQYDRAKVEGTRIVALSGMVRAFAAMFLGEPHRTTRNYKALKQMLGAEIYGGNHVQEPYYAAAYTAYRLEVLFRTQKLDTKLKPARYHILLAARLLINGKPLPAMNSHEMKKRADEIIKVMQNSTEGENVLLKAAEIVTTVADGNFHRDNIRTEPFTKLVFEESAKQATI